MRIYTRTGDDGSTGLYGGARVPKDAPRVQAYGTVDELNATLGWVRATGIPDPVDAVLAEAQHACFRLGAILATIPGKDAGVAPIGEEDVQALEAAIDGMQDGLPSLKNFVLPGGCEAASRLHVARTVCRRAERKVVSLLNDDALDGIHVRWINRLSDWLFVAARRVNFEAGVADVPWVPRGTQGDA